MTTRSDTSRAAWVVLLAGGAGFLTLAALFVPWDPTPGDQFGPARATDYFTAAEIARGEAFARWARVWSYSSLFVSLIVAGAFGFTSWGPRLVDRLPKRWWLRVPLTVFALVLLGRLITLPFAIALRMHVRDYGLSRQPWAGFARDVAVSQAVVIVTTSLALLVLLGSARRWKRRWPFAAATLLAGVVVVGSLAYPVLVEPLFNDFEPLPAGDLRTEILDLAEQQGVDVEEVLVSDASRRTTTLNAYVSGFGGTRRVVVYDNLVEGLDRQETLSVVAHELAHARHRDVLVGTGLGALGVAVAVGSLGLLSARSRWSVADPRSVPRLLALVAVVGVLAAPMENGISRRIEIRADLESLVATGDPGALIALQQELARRSAADVTPPRIAQWWFGSHPTTLERIALAERMSVAEVDHGQVEIP